MNDTIKRLIADAQKATGVTFSQEELDRMYQHYGDDVELAFNDVQKLLSEATGVNPDLSQIVAMKAEYKVPTTFIETLALGETRGQNLAVTTENDVTKARGPFQIIRSQHEPGIKKQLGVSWDEFKDSYDLQFKYMNYLESTYDKLVPELRGMKHSKGFTDEQLKAAVHVFGPNGAKKYFSNLDANPSRVKQFFQISDYFLESRKLYGAPLSVKNQYDYLFNPNATGVTTTTSSMVTPSGATISTNQDIDWAGGQTDVRVRAQTPGGGIIQKAKTAPKVENPSKNLTEFQGGNSQFDFKNPYSFLNRDQSPNYITNPKTEEQRLNKKVEVNKKKKEAEGSDPYGVGKAVKNIPTAADNTYVSNQNFAPYKNYTDREEMQIAAAEREKSKRDFSAIDNLDTEKVYPTGPKIDWKNKTVVQNTPVFPEGYNENLAKQKFSEKAALEKDIYDGSINILKKEFGENFQDKLSSLFTETQSITDRIDDLTAYVEKTYGKNALPEIGDRSEIIKRSQELTDLMVDADSEVRSLAAKIENYNSDLTSLAQRIDAETDEITRNNLIDKYNSLLSEANNTFSTYQQKAGVLDAYSKEYNDLNNLEEQIVKDYNKNVSKLSEAYKQDPKIKKLEELYGKYKTNISEIDKYRNHPRFSSYIKSANSLKELGDKAKILFPNEEEFVKKKQQIQKTADLVSKGYPGSSIMQTITSTLGTAIGAKYGVKAPATGIVGLAVNKFRDKAYNLLGDVMAIGALFANIASESLAADLTWNDVLSVQSLKKDRELNEAYVPSNLQGDFRESFIEVKSGDIFNKNGLAVGDRVAIDDGKIINFRDKDGYKKDLFLTQETRKKFDEYANQVKGQAQVDNNFKRGFVAATPSAIDFASLMIGGGFLSKGMVRLGVSKTVAPNASVFGSSMFQMYGDYYQQYIEEGQSISDAALFSLGKSAAVSMVEAIVGPIEAKLIAKGAGQEALRKLSKVKETSIDLFAKGKMNRSDLFSTIGIGLVSTFKELGLENVEEFVQSEIETAIDNFALNQNEKVSVDRQINTIFATTLITMGPAMLAGAGASMNARADLYNSSLYNATQNKDEFLEVLNKAEEEGYRTSEEATRLKSLVEYVSQEIEDYDADYNLTEVQKASLAGLINTRFFYETKAATATNPRVKENNKKKIDQVDEEIQKVLDGDKEVEVDPSVEEVFTESETPEQFDEAETEVTYLSNNIGKFKDGETVEIDGRTYTFNRADLNFQSPEGILGLKEITEKNLTVNKLKTTEDAIQEQEAGQVPVQPGARGGQEVVEEVQAEPQVTTREGEAEAQVQEEVTTPTQAPQATETFEAEPTPTTTEKVALEAPQAPQIENLVQGVELTRKDGTKAPAANYRKNPETGKWGRVSEQGKFTPVSSPAQVRQLEDALASQTKAVAETKKTEPTPTEVAETPIPKNKVRASFNIENAGRLKTIQTTPAFKNIFSEEQLKNLKVGENTVDLNMTAWGKAQRMLDAKDVTKKTKPTPKKTKPLTKEEAATNLQNALSEFLDGLKDPSAGIVFDSKKAGTKLGGNLRNVLDALVDYVRANINAGAYTKKDFAKELKEGKFGNLKISPKDINLVFDEAAKPVEETKDALQDVDSTTKALAPKLEGRQGRETGVKLRRLVGLITHNGPSVITKLDSSKIRGAQRGRYGKGFYFSNLFKNYDYGDKSTFLNANELNLLNGNLSVANVASSLNTPRYVQNQISKFEKLLESVKNNKDYNEISNEIKKLENIYSTFDKNAEYIQRVLNKIVKENPGIDFASVLENLELRVIEENNLNRLEAVEGLEDSMNNLLEQSGFDGVSVDGGREVLLIPNEKLNEFLVPSQEQFISEAYHKAKKDGSNPELVQAVEDLLASEVVQPAEAEVSPLKETSPEAKVNGAKYTLAEDLPIFKGTKGKRNIDGSLRTVHPGVKGSFVSASEKVAERYKGDGSVISITLPAGTTVETVSLEMGTTPASEFRQLETDAINNSDADIVRLETIDATGLETQYIIKNPDLRNQLKQQGDLETTTEAKADEKAKLEVQRIKNEQKQAKELSKEISKKIKDIMSLSKSMFDRFGIKTRVVDKKTLENEIRAKFKDLAFSRTGAPVVSATKPEGKISSKDFKDLKNLADELGFTLSATKSKSYAVYLDNLTGTIYYNTEADITDPVKNLQDLYGAESVNDLKNKLDQILPDSIKLLVPRDGNQYQDFYIAIPDLDTIEKYEELVNFDELSKQLFNDPKNLDRDLEIAKKYVNNLDWWIISRNESFKPTPEILREFRNEWNWGAVSRNRNLNPTLEMLREFKDELVWSALSENRSFKPTPEILREFRNELNWRYLSENPSLNPTPEILREFRGENWDWGGLSMNPSFTPTPELIREFRDKLRWAYLSLNPNLNPEIIREFKGKWDWGYLSKNPSLNPTPEIIREFKGNWDDAALFSLGIWVDLSQNPSLNPTPEIIKEFKDKWNWWYLSMNPSLNPTPEIIKEFKYKWNWWYLSRNPSYTPEVIRKFRDEWNWDALSANTNLKFTPELIREFKDKWNWTELSQNPSLNPTPEIIKEFKDKWNWMELSFNSSLNPTPELIREFKDKWNWPFLSPNPSLSPTPEIIKEFKYKWNWDTLTKNPSFNITEEIANDFKDYINWTILSEINKLEPWHLNYIKIKEGGEKAKFRKLSEVGLPAESVRHYFPLFTGKRSKQIIDYWADTWKSGLTTVESATTNPDLINSDVKNDYKGGGFVVFSNDANFLFYSPEDNYSFSKETRKERGPKNLKYATRSVVMQNPNDIAQRIKDMDLNGWTRDEWIIELSPANIDYVQYNLENDDIKIDELTSNGKNIWEELGGKVNSQVINTFSSYLEDYNANQETFLFALEDLGADSFPKQHPLYEDAKKVYEYLSDLVKNDKIDNFSKDLKVPDFLQNLNDEFGVEIRITSGKKSKTLPRKTINTFLSTSDGQTWGFYDNKLKEAVLRSDAPMETAVHEAFTHPFLEAAKIQNPKLYRNLLKQAYSNSEIKKSVDADYKGKTKAERNDEYIARAIDKYVKGELDAIKDKGLIKAILDFFKEMSDNLKKILNLPTSVQDIDPKTTLKELAQYSLYGKGTIDLKTPTTVKGVSTKAEAKAEPISKKQALENLKAGLKDFFAAFPGANAGIAFDPIEAGRSQNKAFRQIAKALVDYIRAGLREGEYTPRRFSAELKAGKIAEGLKLLEMKPAGIKYLFEQAAKPVGEEFKEEVKEAPKKERETPKAKKEAPKKEFKVSELPRFIERILDTEGFPQAVKDYLVNNVRPKEVISNAMTSKFARDFVKNLDPSQYRDAVKALKESLANKSLNYAGADLDVIQDMAVWEILALREIATILSEQYGDSKQSAEIYNIVSGFYSFAGRLLQSAGRNPEGLHFIRMFARKNTDGHVFEEETYEGSGVKNQEALDEIESIVEEELANSQEEIRNTLLDGVKNLNKKDTAKGDTEDKTKTPDKENHKRSYEKVVKDKKDFYKAKFEETLAKYQKGFTSGIPLDLLIDYTLYKFYEFGGSVLKARRALSKKFGKDIADQNWNSIISSNLFKQEVDALRKAKLYGAISNPGTSQALGTNVDTTSPSQMVVQAVTRFLKGNSKKAVPQKDVESKIKRGEIEINELIEIRNDIESGLLAVEPERRAEILNEVDDILDMLAKKNEETKLTNWMKKANIRRKVKENLDNMNLVIDDLVKDLVNKNAVKASIAEEFISRSGLSAEDAKPYIELIKKTVDDILENRVKEKLNKSIIKSFGLDYIKVQDEIVKLRERLKNNKKELSDVLSKINTIASAKKDLGLSREEIEALKEKRDNLKEAIKSDETLLKGLSVKAKQGRETLKKKAMGLRRNPTFEKIAEVIRNNGLSSDDIRDVFARSMGTRVLTNKDLSALKKLQTRLDNVKFDIDKKNIEDEIKRYLFKIRDVDRNSSEVARDLFESYVYANMLGAPRTIDTAFSSGYTIYATKVVTSGIIQVFKDLVKLINPTTPNSARTDFTNFKLFFDAMKSTASLDLLTLEGLKNVIKGKEGIAFVQIAEGKERSTSSLNTLEKLEQLIRESERKGDTAMTVFRKFLLIQQLASRGLIVADYITKSTVIPYEINRNLQSETRKQLVDAGIMSPTHAQILNGVEALGIKGVKDKLAADRVEEVLIEEGYKKDGTKEERRAYAKRKAEIIYEFIPEESMARVQAEDAANRIAFTGRIPGYTGALSQTVNQGFDSIARMGADKKNFNPSGYSVFAASLAKLISMPFVGAVFRHMQNVKNYTPLGRLQLQRDEEGKVTGLGTFKEYVYYDRHMNAVTRIPASEHERELRWAEAWVPSVAFGVLIASAFDFDDEEDIKLEKDFPYLFTTNYNIAVRNILEAKGVKYEPFAIYKKNKSGSIEKVGTYKDLPFGWILGATGAVQEKVLFNKNPGDYKTDKSAQEIKPVEITNFISLMTGAVLAFSTQSTFTNLSSNIISPTAEAISGQLEGKEIGPGALEKVAAGFVRQITPFSSLMSELGQYSDLITKEPTKSDENKIADVFSNNIIFRNFLNNYEYTAWGEKVVAKPYGPPLTQVITSAMEEFGADEAPKEYPRAQYIVNKYKDIETVLIEPVEIQQFFPKSKVTEKKAYVEVPEDPQTVEDMRRHAAILKGDELERRFKELDKLDKKELSKELTKINKEMNEQAYMTYVKPILYNYGLTKKLNQVEDMDEVKELLIKEQLYITSEGKLKYRNYVPETE